MESEKHDRSKHGVCEKTSYIGEDEVTLRMQSIGLISVIMAAYNAENTIAQAISSVLKQTYADWELIVIDDCSKDGTASIIKNIASIDSRVRLLPNEQNIGVSETRKRGLLEAHGNWVAIIDSDDLWAVDKLEKQITFQNEVNADLVYTGSAFINSDGSQIDWYLRAPKSITYKQLLKQNLISNSSALVRKELYTKYYATGDDMHEDFAIWLGILKSGGRACGVDEPLLIYRIAQGSKSGNKLKAAKMNWNTYRYVGLNLVQSIYYMGWYTVNGILKYKNIRGGG